MACSHNGWIEIGIVGVGGAPLGGPLKLEMAKKARDEKRAGATPGGALRARGCHERVRTMSERGDRRLEVDSVGLRTKSSAEQPSWAHFVIRSATWELPALDKWMRDGAQVNKKPGMETALCRPFVWPSKFADQSMWCLDRDLGRLDKAWATTAGCSVCPRRGGSKRSERSSRLEGTGGGTAEGSCLDDSGRAFLREGPKVE